jgi:lantibiotic modifying enzyme
MPWQPLLQGKLRDQACASVRAILNDLSRVGREPAGDPSLADGFSGLALLHDYLAQTENAQDHAAVAREYLQAAIAALVDNPTTASLYGGLTGVGWTIAHLRGRLPEPDGEVDLAEIDEILWHHLEPSPWPDDYDLLSGLVGFGVYALERLSSWAELQRPTPAACLERVVDHLAATAEHRAEGITWWTDPKWLPTFTREKFPSGYHNLGLAHGVPGVIALLGQACAAEIAVAKARPLLEEAVRWLLAQHRTGGYAAWVGAEGADGPARLAWCYGDPGVAVALLGAARSVGEGAWEKAALAIARRAADRPPELAGVADAGLCHGGAGLGHFFNRMFQATGDLQLKEAAHLWFKRTLEMRHSDRGIGGYPACDLADDGTVTWRDATGFLTGAAGVALALLAACTPIEPAWDRVLLAAIPPSSDPQNGERGRMGREAKGVKRQDSPTVHAPPCGRRG